MKIQASDVTLASAHSQSQRLDVHERLDVSSGRTPPQPQGTPVAAGLRVQISDKAQAALDAEQASAAQEKSSDSLDPRMRLLVSLIERLTGRSVRIFDMSEFQTPDNTGDRPSAPPPSSQSQSSAPAGFSLAYDYHASYQEQEQTAFAATGQVRTADGKEISFSLSMIMQRSYSEQVDISVRQGEAAKMKDPLVLDFDGNADSLSSVAFNFDLDADGSAESVRLPVGGSGILVFDRNANNKSDDGSELFGARTGDGFAELAALDDDGNGWIDESDSAFSRLKLWNPQGSTLQTLSAAGVGALYLGKVSTPFQVKDAQGETLAVTRASSIYLKENGEAGTVSQVDLAV